MAIKLPFIILNVNFNFEVEVEISLMNFRLAIFLCINKLDNAKRLPFRTNRETYPLGPIFVKMNPKLLAIFLVAIFVVAANGASLSASTYISSQYF